LDEDSALAGEWWRLHDELGHNLHGDVERAAIDSGSYALPRAGAGRNGDRGSMQHIRDDRHSDCGKLELGDLGRFRLLVK
jgi:hypothetical protein